MPPAQQPGRPVTGKDGQDPCLDDEQVGALIEGRMAGQDLARVRRHIAGCPDCLQLVTASAGDLPDASMSPSVPMSMPTPVGDASRGWQPPAEFAEFRLVRPLGRGAMGLVYLGHDTLLDRQVAVKFVTGVAVDASAQRRFLVEARAVARLNHPNVVTLFRVGEIDGHPYLVSEYVEGTLLSELPRPLPWRRALGLGLGLARGLSAAHRQGVLHRDIKPQNAILTRGEQVKVLDFGLAKLGNSSASSSQRLDPAALLASSGHAPAELTRTGGLIGTPRYMAPEVFCAREITPRTDVYSAGAVLYELICGVPPHQARTLHELAAAVVQRDAVPLGERAPGVPRELCAVVDACLQRDPQRRPASGEVLSEELARCEALLREPERPPLDPGRARWLVLPALVACILGLFALRYLPGRRPAGMVLIPGGTFEMGSPPEEIDAAFHWCQHSAARDECHRELFDREQPVHRVRLSPYRLDRTEVTNEAFAAWLNQRQGLRVVYDPAQKEHWVMDGPDRLVNLYPSYPTYGLQEVEGRFAAVPGYEGRPVTQVTWLGAQGYCQAHGWRLPTEAEWEYAARPLPGYRFPWGTTPPRCDGVAFGRLPGQECAALGAQPAPVGTAAQDRSPQGIYDLSGNVGEWVLDRFAERYPECPQGCQDPVVGEVRAGAGAAPVLRVFRGGDWAEVAAICRAAGRGRWRQDEGLKNIGFRCAAGDRVTGGSGRRAGTPGPAGP